MSLKGQGYNTETARPAEVVHAPGGRPGLYQLPYTHYGYPRTLSSQATSIPPSTVGLSREHSFQDSRPASSVGILDKTIHKASTTLLIGGVLAFIAGLLLLMAFASPYWLASWDDTFSNFRNMGLWEFCFHHFRYPKYQFDRVFEGCHYIFSEEYLIIREWLQPGWLMTVEAFISIALILSFLTQIIIAFNLMRWPLALIRDYEHMISTVTFILQCLTVFPIFLGVAIFGHECWRRDWLLYPNFNYLSWSYSFAVISMFFHCFSAIFLFADMRIVKERADRQSRLLNQMETQHHPLQLQQFH